MITTYRGKQRRPAHAEGAPPSPGTAAARCRLDTAARRAAEVEAIEGAENVVPIRPAPGPDETA